MKVSFDNEVMSSFHLWLDHTILEEGEAYTNFASRLFEVPSPYTNFYTYGLPFRQIVADASITGAQIMSGVSIGGNSIKIGQSGLVDISYDKGRAYFSSKVNSTQLSGLFAVKDYNIYLSSQTEYSILFDTKYETRPKTSREFTGLAPNVVTYPAIFITNFGTKNSPFAFGGMDKTDFQLRLVILADNAMSLDAVLGILRDKQGTYVPWVRSNAMPFNNLGGAIGGFYSYSNLLSNSYTTPFDIFISRIEGSRTNARNVISLEIKDLNPNMFSALVDVDLEVIRQPRV